MQDALRMDKYFTPATPFVLCLELTDDSRDPEVWAAHGFECHTLDRSLTDVDDGRLVFHRNSNEGPAVTYNRTKADLEKAMRHEWSDAKPLKTECTSAGCDGCDFCFGCAETWVPTRVVKFVGYYWRGAAHRPGNKPAIFIEYVDGTREWRFAVYGSCHRTDGPARVIIAPDGTRKETYFLVGYPFGADRARFHMLQNAHPQWTFVSRFHATSGVVSVVTNLLGKPHNPTTFAIKYTREELNEYYLDGFRLQKPHWDLLRHHFPAFGFHGVDVKYVSGIATAVGPYRFSKKPNDASHDVYFSDYVYDEDGNRIMDDWEMNKDFKPRTVNYLVSSAWSMNGVAHVREHRYGPCDVLHAWGKPAKTVWHVTRMHDDKTVQTQVVEEFWHDAQGRLHNTGGPAVRVRTVHIPRFKTDKAGGKEEKKEEGDEKSKDKDDGVDVDVDVDVSICEREDEYFLEGRKVTKEEWEELRWTTPTINLVETLIPVYAPKEGSFDLRKLTHARGLGMFIRVKNGVVGTNGWPEEFLHSFKPNEPAFAGRTTDRPAKVQIFAKFGFFFRDDKRLPTMVEESVSRRVESWACGVAPAFPRPFPSAGAAHRSILHRSGGPGRIITELETGCGSDGAKDIATVVKQYWFMGVHLPRSIFKIECGPRGSRVPGHPEWTVFEEKTPDFEAGTGAWVYTKPGGTRDDERATVDIFPTPPRYVPQVICVDGSFTLSKADPFCRIVFDDQPATIEKNAVGYQEYIDADDPTKLVTDREFKTKAGTRHLHRVTNWLHSSPSDDKICIHETFVESPKTVCEDAPEWVLHKTNDAAVTRYRNGRAYEKEFWIFGEKIPSRQQWKLKCAMLGNIVRVGDRKYVVLYHHDSVGLGCPIEHPVSSICVEKYESDAWNVVMSWFLRLMGEMIHEDDTWETFTAKWKTVQYEKLLALGDAKDADLEKADAEAKAEMAMIRVRAVSHSSPKLPKSAFDDLPLWVWMLKAKNLAERAGNKAELGVTPSGIPCITVSGTDVDAEVDWEGHFAFIPSRASSTTNTGAFKRTGLLDSRVPVVWHCETGAALSHTACGSRGIDCKWYALGGRVIPELTCSWCSMDKLIEFMTPELTEWAKETKELSEEEQVARARRRTIEAKRAATAAAAAAAATATALVEEETGEKESRAVAKGEEGAEEGEEPLGKGAAGATEP